MKTLQFSTFRNVFLLFLVFSLPSMAQMNYSLAPNPDLKITGTSTIHDWEMVSSTAKGEGQFSINAGKVSAAKNVSIVMPAESIKSGKSGMDKNAYSAMKSKEFKDVKFTLKAFCPKGNGFEATGDFIIAGVTNTVKFPVTINQTSSNINVKGFYPFKLTDFKIDPPTALLGTVKTGDEVSIHFNVTFQPSK